MQRPNNSNVLFNHPTRANNRIFSQGSQAQSVRDPNGFLLFREIVYKELPRGIKVLNILIKL